MDRVNRYCRLFPCHKGIEDCTFCFCPLYPCEDKDLGRYVYTNDSKRVWSCKDCSWIHKRMVVDEIYRLIRERYRIRPREIKETGIIIISHGSRVRGADNIIEEIINTTKRELGLEDVFHAYLKFNQPDLSKIVSHLATKRCKRIIIVPFFLFSGSHVCSDLPEAIKDEMEKYPSIEFIYTQNLGMEKPLSTIVIDRIREVVRNDRSIPR